MYGHRQPCKVSLWDHIVILVMQGSSENILVNNKRQSILSTFPINIVGLTGCKLGWIERDKETGFGSLPRKDCSA